MATRKKPVPRARARRGRPVAPASLSTRRRPAKRRLRNPSAEARRGAAIKWVAWAQAHEIEPGIIKSGLYVVQTMPDPTKIKDFGTLAKMLGARGINPAPKKRTRKKPGPFAHSFMVAKVLGPGKYQPLTRKTSHHLAELYARAIVKRTTRDIAIIDLSLYDYDARAGTLKKKIPLRVTPKSRRAVRGHNPVPPSSRSLTTQKEKATKLHRTFSGHDVDQVTEITLPDRPDVLLQVGTLDGIPYTAKRDGKTERYIHKFHKGSRPILAVSPDGKEMHLIGGNYDFTERGFVDTDKHGRPIE